MMRMIAAHCMILLSVCASIAFADADRHAPSGADEINVGPADWPWWRGPNRNGVAAEGQTPPLSWSESHNVLWKSPVPGRGHGSPTIVGDQVFLATAGDERDVQSVLCFDRRTGERRWKTDLHRQGPAPNENKKSSQASVTPACDGRRVFVNFQHAGAVYATALALDGSVVWERKISDFAMHQGYGPSPAVYKSLVMFSADNKGGGAIAALDRASGDMVWKKERPKLPNYTSPVILNAAGREQLVFTGCNLVTSLEPLTGKKLWEIEGATTECVTSTVTDGNLVFTSGGYPKNHTAAVRADGSGTIAWENTVRVYVPSMLIRDGHLYAVTDDGVAICWKSESGKEVWKKRLEGKFTASPVMAGENIFAISESGKTFIFKANPAKFELVAENQLGDEVYASPAICGNCIFLRAASFADGRRQESLYCLGTGRERPDK